MRLVLGVVLAMLVSPVYAQSVSFPYVQYRNQPTAPPIKFQQGRPEENGATADTGTLTGYLLLNHDATSSPLVILLAGCSGNQQETNHDWLEHWEAFFWARGFSYLSIDSFTSRGMTESCSAKADDHWAYRRRDDAYSALEWLVKVQGVAADQVYLVGRDQGGKAVMRAMETKLLKSRPFRFRGAIALYPSCSDLSPFYYDIVHLLVGDKDDLTPMSACQDVVGKLGQTNLVMQQIAGGPHGFDDYSERRVLAGKLVGGDLHATRQARDYVEKVWQLKSQIESKK